MKKSIFFIILTLLLLTSSNAMAHFGMVIPSDSMVMQNESRTIKITMSFSHPFEMTGMDLVRPKKCSVFLNGKEESLISILKETSVMEHKAWELSYEIKRPGVYAFYMEPEPYWEPAEDCYIIHYTKTVTGAFGIEENWDKPLGLKTEIVPLTRPFGLYAGNIFQGIVMLDNKPVPYADVEVEYFNREKKITAPNDYMITQVIKADSNGVFSYVAPVCGWWGFAALNTSDKKIILNGEEKDIELGAVLWVEFLQLISK